MFRKFLKRSLPVLILLLGLTGAYYLLVTQPTVERTAPPVPILKVEAVPLQPASYTVSIASQGIVSARTESTLIPEVSGKITFISSSFREGGFFDEGDLLLKIDPSDYEADVTIAKANLAEAQLRLAEEEAASSQAELDWERLGFEDKPTSLVLREPQLVMARANVAASEARLEEAMRDLRQTEITAPYEGRVLEKHVDIGQVVSPGSLLAEVYAVDYAEIRLPLTNEEYAILDLPPLLRGSIPDSLGIPVILKSRFGQEELSWQGHLVRVEGSVDVRSRQTYVVAQVDDPYGISQGQPLKVGLFVEAEIEGQTLESVYVLPRIALREGHFILTIDENNRIKRVPVNPLWSNSEVIVFRQPEIVPGTLVSLTQMALAIDGMEVQPIVQGTTPASMSADDLADSTTISDQ